MKKLIVFSSLMLAVLAVFAVGTGIAEEAATAVAAAPVPNKGHTGWVIVSARLVSLMTIPSCCLVIGAVFVIEESSSLFVCSF